MRAVLKNNFFSVKKQVGTFKVANNYDVFDPNTQEKIMECREPNLGVFAKFMRFFGYQRNMPFCVEITMPDGQKVLTVKRGIALFLSKVDVLDEQGKLVGSFKQKQFSMGGIFDVLDAQEKNIGVIFDLDTPNQSFWRPRGSWINWDYRFVRGDNELAQISKKLEGLGKEPLAIAQNYMLSIQTSVPSEDPIRQLIVAAVMCIDIV